MDWKLALVQHPMYFLIRVGSQCAETIDIAHDCGYFARCGYMEGEL